MKSKLTLLTISTLLATNLAFAAESVPAPASVTQPVTPKEAAGIPEANKTEDTPDTLAIKKRLKTYFNNQDVIVYMAESPIPNTYLLTLADGTSILYFKDTDYGVVGDLFDMKNRENLSSGTKSGYNKTIIKQFKPEEGITYASTNTEKSVKNVYVFTDPTCGYCRKLHHELADYEAQGLNIVYLPFPRGGRENQFAYNELIDVWCSTDRKQAMDLAKNDKGAEIKLLPDYKITPECKAIVDKGIDLGAKLSISGTPSLFTDSGYNIPGYVEPVKLRSVVDEKN